MFTEYFDYLYVEPSSFCNLKCPRCPRTTNKSNYKLENLSVDLFKQFLSDPVWKNVKIIEYGGNHGDPLMNPDLPQFIRWAHEIQPQAKQVVHTSGSHSPNIWKPIVKALTPEDEIYFSVDGLQSSNHQYRVGSRWDWIEQAIQLSADKVPVLWKYIVFNFNQHQILEAIQKAKDLGVSHFLLTKSHLFNGPWLDETGIDPMAPEPQCIAATPDAGSQIEPMCQIS